MIYGLIYTSVFPSYIDKELIARVHLDAIVKSDTEEQARKTLTDELGELDSSYSFCILPIPEEVTDNYKIFKCRYPDRYVRQNITDTSND